LPSAAAFSFANFSTFAAVCSSTSFFCASFIGSFGTGFPLASNGLSTKVFVALFNSAIFAFIFSMSFCLPSSFGFAFISTSNFFSFSFSVRNSLIFCSAFFTFESGWSLLTPSAVGGLSKSLYHSGKTVVSL
jgi:hypothetical protein